MKAWFGQKYDEYPSEYTKIFEVQSSSQNFEEDVATSGFGLAQIKPEGSGVTYDSHQQGYTSRYTHTAYGLGFVCTREELADNLYGKVAMSRAGSLAFSMRQTRENVGANVLSRAATAGYTGGDGQLLFSTAHPNAAGGTFSNTLATAADLSEAALEDIVIQIGNATDQKGLKISLRPKRLIIPIESQFDATRILETQLRVDTANNDINALKAMGSIPEVVVNHYLADTNGWYVLTDSPEGLKWYDREGVEFTNDGDFDTDNIKHKGYMRFSAGWSDPRGVFGSEGA